MELLRIPRIMQETSTGHILHGRRIGFVPTMGALHEGHLSLVRTSKAENDITVVSIFVNPLQFGTGEDFNKYPRKIDDDLYKLRKENIDILFMPDASQIYPHGFSTHVDVQGLSERLCGVFRQCHFRGVATIVAKLFNLIRPARVYLGQKDFQQVVIIKRMVKDLDLSIDVVACPTIREHDGIAMSSRNLYLNAKERQAAAVIYRCLTKTIELIKSGIIEKARIKRFMKERLSEEPLITEIQYASVYNPETLEEIERVEEEALLAIALKIGSIRLIDNMQIKL